MKKSVKIDLVEKFMQDTYQEEVKTPEPSPAWQATLMEKIANDFTPKDSETKNIEKEFLYFSWIAAGIAVALIMVLTVRYSVSTDSLEHNINELYSYTAFDNLTTPMEAN